jgi:protein PET100
MYIMFPIGIMYYFGTNLDARFKVPDFWPGPEQSHKIPYERDEIDKEIARLRERRLAARDRRLELEKMNGGTENTENQDEQARNPKPGVLEAVKLKEAEQDQDNKGTKKLRWFI